MKSKLKRPVASFTFDDFAKSALGIGGAVLEQYGGRGTYYASGSLCGTTIDGVENFDVDDLIAANERGHEIADHSFAHLRAPYSSSSTLVADVERNAAFLRERIGDVVPTSFAFPFGETSLRTKHLYANHFACSRGTTHGINRGMLDLGQLRAIRIETQYENRIDIPAIVAEARERADWIIFLIHDISNVPSEFGTTPKAFEQAVTCCVDAGIDILPVKNALSRACFGE